MITAAVLPLVLVLSGQHFHVGLLKKVNKRKSYNDSIMFTKNRNMKKVNQDFVV